MTEIIYIFNYFVKLPTYHDNMMFYVFDTVPVFVNSQYSTLYDCQLYYSPQSSSIGDKVVMKVNVSDIVTILWTVTLHGKTEVIDQYNEDYVLRDKNKVQ